MIGIAGRAGAGKDTVAQMIIYLKNCDRDGKPYSLKDFYFFIDAKKHYKSYYQIYKFAEKLKGRVALTWDINRENLENNKFKNMSSPLGISWRELLQKEGTIMRSLDEDYWIKALFCNIQSHKAIISDVRFLNEIEAIKKENIQNKVVRVYRNVPEMDHISETEHLLYKDYDYVIDNIGTFSDLLDSVYNMLLVLDELS